MSYLEDPRVFFAAERTFLAWLRTGLGIAALGLALAKYRIFIATLQQEPIKTAKQEPSFFIGVIIILIGLLSILFALIQFRRFIKTLNPKEFPPKYTHRIAVHFGLITQLLILLLLGYLILY